MIYKNYILGKKLSELVIYISIVLFAFIITVEGVFLLISLLVGFVCELWRLVNANCNFCVFIFCIIYTLIWFVLIRNICYLLTYLLKYKHKQF